MIGLPSFGQSIKDYFIPSSPNNKASYYSPDKAGARTGLTKVIYYVENEDFFDVMTAPMFNGKPTSIVTRTVEIVDNEVHMVSSISTGITETNVKRTHVPPSILLKFPPEGQSISWALKTFVGDEEQCKATWTTVNVNGTVLKALKVEKQIEGFSTTRIEYYVKGIGLYDTNLEDEHGSVMVFEKFDGLEYDPTAK